MFENFLKLFDNLLGYFVILGIFLCILCIILFQKRIKKRKYVVMTYELYKNALYIPIIASLFLLITFTIQYCFNAKDATGEDIKEIKKNHFKDLKIKTFNGKRFTIDYAMINRRKLEKMAKEKGIDIVEPREQERIIK